MKTNHPIHKSSPLQTKPDLTTYSDTRLYNLLAYAGSQLHSAVFSDWAKETLEDIRVETERREALALKSDAVPA